MQGLYFLIAGIALYAVSDWIVERVERHHGRRLEHRSLLFFAIIMTLALTSFSIIRLLLQP